MPQRVILDIKHWGKFSNGKFIKYLGIRNWTKASSNPKWVELLISYDSEKYVSMGHYYLIDKSGTQLLRIRHNNLENLNLQIKKIKIVITETYGAECVCLSNILLYEEYRINSGFLISESKENILNEFD